MYILKHILLVVSLFAFDIGFSILVATIIKNTFSDLPLYVYNGIGGIIGIIGLLIYLPLSHKLKETRING